MRILFCASVLALCALASAADICPGQPNLQEVWTGVPALVNTTVNGQRYIAGFANDSQPLNIVHVYGTAYEMGFAAGQLMKAEITALIPEMFEWVYAMIGKYIKFLPAWLQTIIETDGVGALLDITWDLTSPYQPAYFLQELNGLADASGVSLSLLKRLSMFPEATSMACTIVGANGPAVAESQAGMLLQLRALDWGSDAPVARYPLLMVYHPSAGFGHPFAQLGWPGLVGAVTGVSPFIFQSEKVWGRSNSMNPRTGIPATFLIRDILQFDQTLDQALERIHTANRTCAYFLGLGERATSKFNLVENSFQYVNTYDDKSFPAYPGHALKDGLVYVDKHEQPSNWGCMESLMNTTYGSLTPTVFMQQITARAQTGDQHIAVFDEQGGAMYVAVAQAGTATTPLIPAYNRPFLRIDISSTLSKTMKNDGEVKA